MDDFSKILVTRLAAGWLVGNPGSHSNIPIHFLCKTAPRAHMFLLLATLCQTEIEFVTTPFGLRPKQCVVSIPDGGKVSEVPSSDESGVTLLKISHPVLGERIHVPDSICHDPRYQNNRPRDTPNVFDTNIGAINNKSCDEPPCKTGSSTHYIKTAPNVPCSKYSSHSLS